MRLLIDFLYYFLCFVGGFVIGANIDSIILGLVAIVISVFVLWMARIYLLEKFNVQ